MKSKLASSEPKLNYREGTKNFVFFTWEVGKLGFSMVQIYMKAVQSWPLRSEKCKRLVKYQVNAAVTGSLCLAFIRRDQKKQSLENVSSTAVLSPFYGSSQSHVVWM